MSDRPPAEQDPRSRLTPTKIVVSVILLVGIVVPLLVPTYDQKEPRLFGFPFFYWYQLSWVFICCRALRTELLAAEAGAGRLPPPVR